jgi:hypothetical protein
MAFHWMYKKPLLKRGVLIASDSRAEWMIPWLWFHYVKHNKTPILVVDLGMSKDARNWCERIGLVLDFAYPNFCLSPKDQVPLKLQRTYERLFKVKDFWKSREQWFKKPFCMLQSPFETTVWLDLDCEVRGSLADLFTMHENNPGIRIAKESERSIATWVATKILKEKEVLYNCGVVVYTHGTPVLLDWTKEILLHNHLASGEQDTLCYLLRKKNYRIYPLPKIYNWHVKRGENPEAVINHWVGDWGKAHIANQIKNR